MENKEINIIDTLKTKSLDPTEMPFSESKLKLFNLVICDIDYTLVDFEPSNQAGIRKLKEIFGEKMGEHIDNVFQIVLAGNRKREDEPWDKRDEYNSIMQRIAQLQAKTLSDPGTKVWSREAYIIISAEKARVKVDKRMVEKARDAYWQELKNNYKIFPDAEKFINFLQSSSVPLVLMTGSDAVLKVSEDLSLSYDPEFSRTYKIRRLSEVFPDIQIVIGDPIDKQYPEYFDELFRQISKMGYFSTEKILVVGDSDKADLMIPRQRGYPTLLVTR